MAVITGSGQIEGTDGEDQITGSDGFDMLLGNGGNDTLEGAGGFDFAVYWSSGSAVGVQLFAGIVNDGFGGTDRLSNIEGIIGSAFDDIILGSNLTDVLLGLDGADTIEGLGGDDALNGNGGDDKIVGGAGEDTVYFSGSRADYTVTATDGGFRVVDNRGMDGTDVVTEAELFRFEGGDSNAGNDSIYSAADVTNPNAKPTTPGGGGGDGSVVRGTAGNDVLVHANGQQRTYEGLGGRDTLDMDGFGFRGAVVEAQADGSVAVSHGGDRAVLRGVEEVRFADGRLVFDENDPAAQVLRLYEAALDRLPDQGGLNFWIGSVQNGQPLSGLASGFIASEEFRSRFGSMADNGAFVDQLYLNVLDRAGEAAGRKFWVDSLNGGTSRADVLVAFSNSTENKAGTALLVQNGIWDRSEAATEVARLYDTVFGRKADVSGLTFWKDALEGGTATLGQMADAFTGGAEFRGQYGALNNRDFANALYVNSLDRPADQAGLDHWTNVLNSGVSRADVVLAFSESREHVALTEANIQSENQGQYGILFA